MKIGIYGAGQFGLYVKERFNRAAGEVAFLIDNNKKVDGLNIITEKVFFDDYIDQIDCIWICILSDDLRTQIIANMLYKGFSKIKIVDVNLYNARLEINEENIRRFVKRYNEFLPTVNQIQIPVTMRCNLNCKACGYYANMGPKYQDMNALEIIDKVRLLGKILVMNHLVFIGGEPLMKNDLDEILIEARAIFPRTQLQIQTNGVLLSKVNKKIIDAIRMTGTKLRITLYNPTFDVVDDIVEICRKENIEFILKPRVCEFDTYLSRGDVNSCLAWNHCDVTKTCHFLWDNRLHMCAPMARRFEYKEELGLDISRDEYEECSCDLLDTDIDGWEFASKLSNPVSLCRFCSLERKKIDWKGGHLDWSAEDWMV